MKKLLFSSVLSLLIIGFFAAFFPRPAFTQIPSCSSQGGVCRTSRCQDDEASVPGTGCTAPRTVTFCCVPRSQVTPAACSGTCRTSCQQGEVELLAYNVCETSGQVCCNDNPLVGNEESENLPGPTCNGGEGIDTAIGCIPFNDTSTFISFILRWAIGIGGGIAFLLIIYAAFMIMSSQGNPERLKAGQELLTSAVAGVILLIFSIFILRIIGVNILGIF